MGKAKKQECIALPRLISSTNYCLQWMLRVETLDSANRQGCFCLLSDDVVTLSALVNLVYLDFLDGGHRQSRPAKDSCTRDLVAGRAMAIAMR
jgi:hypothetical protein